MLVDKATVNWMTRQSSRRMKAMNYWAVLVVEGVWWLGSIKSTACGKDCTCGTACSGGQEFSSVRIHVFSWSLAGKMVVAGVRVSACLRDGLEIGNSASYLEWGQTHKGESNINYHGPSDPKKAPNCENGSVALWTKCLRLSCSHMGFVRGYIAENCVLSESLAFLTII
jgi:hypothetical protein